MRCYIKYFFDNRCIFFHSWVGLCSPLHGNRFLFAITIAKSSQKEVDFLLLLGLTEAERIVTNKIENISKQVYNNIQYDNLSAISSEPNNVREYVNQVVENCGR